MADPWEAFPATATASDPWASFPATKPPRAASSAQSDDRAPTRDSRASTPGVGGQIVSGLMEGATGALGAPIDLTNAFLVAPALKGVNAVFGTNYQPSAEPFGGSAGLRRGLNLAPPSDSAGDQVARRIAQSLGGTAVSAPAMGANTLSQIATALLSSVGGGTAAALSQQALPGNAGAEIAAELIGGLGTGASIAGVTRRAARKTAEGAVPTVQNLESRAGDLFEGARRSGVEANQTQTRQLASDFKTIAQNEGLISPTGRVSEAYPKAREALRLVEDYAQGTMNVPQMQTVRKVLADGAKAPDDSERRMATQMLKAFDDFTSHLSPQLADARKLYSQAMRGEKLETLRELAGSRAGQFSGSGFENALRTEYRQLNNKIIKGQERGWSPEQADAIKRVAEGSGVSNALRNVGRMAPTGPLSFMSTAGIPAAIGTAVGGPMLGATLATGASMAGYGARALAAQRVGRYADIAELLARGGQPTNSIGSSDSVRRGIIQALIGDRLGAPR